MCYFFFTCQYVLSIWQKKHLLCLCSLSLRAVIWAHALCGALCWGIREQCVLLASQFPSTTWDGGRTQLSQSGLLSLALVLPTLTGKEYHVLGVWLTFFWHSRCGGTRPWFGKIWSDLLTFCIAKLSECQTCFVWGLLRKRKSILTRWIWPEMSWNWHTAWLPERNGWSSGCCNVLVLQVFRMTMDRCTFWVPLV